MTHGVSGTQTRELLAEKTALARRLISQGLRDHQIQPQLRCSRNFLRKIRREMEQEDHAAHGST